MATPIPTMPDLPTIAATLQHRFAPERWALDTLGRIRLEIEVPPHCGGHTAPIAATNDDGRTCQTCEGECTIPACTDPTCACELDPPCRERACPDCGGIGSV